MREWIPVSTSPKGRLALAAVKEFGSRPFDEVTVTELATAANVTTGAIYHHFSSKLGLYTFVRADVERRLLDRMEGAAAVSSGSPAVKAALLVGFDFAVSQSFAHLLSTPPPAAGQDQLAVTLATVLGGPADPLAEALARVLTAAWRAALTAVADGIPPEHARSALLALDFRLPGGA
jgi:AcrR family transcriptional regulator